MSTLRSIRHKAVEVLSRAELRAGLRDADRGQRLFFLRGHPRSGTNWMGQVLNLHPKIYCTGEFQLERVARPVRRLQEVPWQICSEEPVRTALEDAFQDLVRRCVVAGCSKHRPNAEWFGDRSPTGVVDLIPGSRYFWLLRDGRDVIVSWTFHQLRKGPKVIRHSFPPGVAKWLLETTEAFNANPRMFEDQPELLLSDERWVRHTAEEWDRRYKLDRAAADAMAESGAESDLLEIRYEAMHADPETERARMYEFLDLDPAEARPLSAKSRTVAGFTEDDPTQFLRKGRVGDWQNYFTDQARAWFHDAAGDSLVDAGYAKDENW